MMMIMMMIIMIEGGGVTFIDVSWDDPEACGDTRYHDDDDDDISDDFDFTRYKVALNGDSHFRTIKETWQRIENISPGEYQVMVMMMMVIVMMMMSGFCDGGE